MNFLGHLYLSGNFEEIKIGNFIADSIKGNKYKDFPEGIGQGILLHRKIDSFTDSHPLFLQSKRRLNSHYNHFGGIVIDVFYDHFLSKNWYDFSNIRLKEFARDSYSLLLKNYSILPENVKFFLPYMIKHNWLLMYSELEGIERVLIGLSKRTSLPEETNFAMKILHKNYDMYKEEFYSFFKDIVNYVSEKEGINLNFHV